MVIITNYDNLKVFAGPDSDPETGDLFVTTGSAHGFDQFTVQYVI